MAKHKVLVVSGDDSFGASIAGQLEGIADVKRVASRDDALDCATLGCPDLVLMDHDSANLDCLDLVAITNALRCRLNCALVTSRLSEQIRREAERQHVAQVLVKPVDRRALEALLAGEEVPGYVPLRHPAATFVQANA